MKSAEEYWKTWWNDDDDKEAFLAVVRAIQADTLEAAALARKAIDPARLVHPETALDLYEEAIRNLKAAT